MKKKVLEFIKRHSLFSDKKILVATSGGVDSMALLYFLLSLKNDENLEIAAVHYEHGIRGDESKRDADFVANWCKDRNIVCYMASGDAPKYAKEHKITVEMAARELRYQFLYKILKQENFDAIATAHHADDQAETVILNLLRGAGTRGLAAIRPKQNSIIRPFLQVTKSEIIQYATKEGIDYREDSTNASLEYRRNRIRRELLPALESYQSGVKSHLNVLAEIAREESDYLDNIAENKLELLNNPELFKIEHIAIARRIIMLFLLKNGITTDFKHIEEIRKLLLKGNVGKRIEISENVFIELSYSGLQIVKISDEILSGNKIDKIFLKIPGENILKDFNIKITAKILDKIPLKTLPDEYYVDFDKLKGEIGVRTRKDGDVIQLAFGKKSVKKIFMEEKIDRSRRSKYPIIFLEKDGFENILWLPYLRRSVFKKATETTKRALYMKVEEI